MGPTPLEIFTYLIALILILLPIFDWTVSYILFRAVQRTNNIAIKERMKMAIVLATATTLNGLIAFNRLLPLHLDGIVIIILLSISLILISVPNLYWLSLYYRNKLRK